jgi:hypothetical protein
MQLTLLGIALYIRLFVHYVGALRPHAWMPAGPQERLLVVLAAPATAGSSSEPCAGGGWEEGCWRRWSGWWRPLSVLVCLAFLVCFAFRCLCAAGQWLFLRGLDVPVYDFRPTPYSMVLKYVAAALPMETEIGMTIVGQLFVIAVFAAMASVSAVSQTITGHFPHILYVGGSVSPARVVRCVGVGWGHRAHVLALPMVLVLLRVLLLLLLLLPLLRLTLLLLSCCFCFFCCCDS